MLDIRIKVCYTFLVFGSIAQLGEHLPYKQRVIGSSPIVPTKARFTRAFYYRGVAQLAARVVWDHQAAGSNPVTPTTKVR